MKILGGVLVGLLAAACGGDFASRGGVDGVGGAETGGAATVDPVASGGVATGGVAGVGTGGEHLAASAVSGSGAGGTTTQVVMQGSGGAPASTGGAPMSSGGAADAGAAPVIPFTGPDGQQWVCSWEHDPAIGGSCRCLHDSPENRANWCSRPGYHCDLDHCPTWGPECCGRGFDPVSGLEAVCQCGTYSGDHCSQPDVLTCP